MAKTGKTFITVTNADIYDEIKKLREDNSTAHNFIIARQDKTNGGVKLSMWIATTALAVALIAIGYLFSHLNHI
jgi:hypothetical protein